MQTTYSTTDYVTKFQYKELIPIIGEPNLTSILQLIKEVKQTIQCMSIKLGRGQFGHLG